MSKSKSIIFSITGIIIVSLFLIVYTFGYVLVKIKGNENSILSSLISKKVSVAYKEISNTSNGETISPGYEFIKTFTATNDGNVEVNYHIYLDNVENEFVRVQDITYTLYRSELNGTIDTNNLSDSNIVATGTFPTTDAYIKFNEEIETPNNYYTYALKINYVETTESQDEDDGHIFSFRVQLDMNYPFTENTLAYNILNNAVNVTNGTTYFAGLTSRNMVDNVSAESDKILSTAKDTDGISYYFRGNPEDNYVQYAGMCWRVVRIEGDGSVKLILASEKECSSDNLTTSSGFATDGDVGVQGTLLEAYYGYKTVGNFRVHDYINSEENARTKLNDWLERKITSESDKALLKNETWCIGDQTNAYDFGTWGSDGTGEIVGTTSDLIASGSYFNYTAGNKYYVTKTPSYKCETTGVEGEVDINKVGMLTFDEIVYAGGGSSSNSNYYLNNNAITNDWLTLSIGFLMVMYEADAVFLVSDTGEVDKMGTSVRYSYPLRPSIVLKSNTTITSGTGTKTDPYIVE